MNKLPNNELSDLNFFANTVHEIRTPIQTIIGTLELLHDTPMNTEQWEYVRQLEFSSGVLLTLSNDILDFSKILSKQFVIEKIPFNIIDVAEQIFDLVCIEAYNKNLELITDIDYLIPCSIMGDPTRIQQVLLNLIKNAVKFTDKGYVWLGVHPRKNNSILLFEVYDSGKGISEQQKQTIFADYAQADSSINRLFGGTGLGLSIAKNLVELMGGKIGVKDNPHGGSVFWFTLPLIATKSNGLQSIQKKYSIKPGKHIKILLVDDSDYSLKSLSKKLHMLTDCTIDTANSGALALTKMHTETSKNTPYDLAMIDLIMPKMDGWRLASTIRNDTTIKKTKLYLIIPEGQLGGEAKMKMLDWFSGYLYKPIKISMLSNLLHKYFNIPLDLATIPQNTALELGLKQGKQKTKIQYYDHTKILIAEDHPVNRKLMQSFLTKLHITVYSATNGTEAIKQVKEHPDLNLIFMDIQMPIKNGVEATKEIRGNGYKGIIIACTANNDKHFFAKYLQIGMNDVLVKPFKQQNIQSMLKKWNKVFAPKLQQYQNMQLWDITDMLDTTDNNIALTKELVTQYILQAKKLFKDAEKAIHTKDLDLLRLTAHTIKGSSATLSITGIALSAKLCEDAARHKDLKKASAYFKELQTAYAKFYILAQKKLNEWK